jgi:hypothetical protein
LDCGEGTDGGAGGQPLASSGLGGVTGGADSAYQPDQGAFGKLWGSDEGGPGFFGSIGDQAAMGWEACAFGVEEAPCARVRAAGDG